MITFLSVLLTASLVVHADIKIQKVSLLELYSSEGCSSCPPAEKSLYKLKEDKDLWKKFVPVNFHVDYWNRLGWTDRFSNKKFTDRQHEYSRLWNTNRVYTPAFIVDGKDKGPRLPVMAGNTEKSSFQLKVEKSNLNFKISTDAASTEGYKIYFALLANGVESQVKSGENNGKVLRHNFVVIDLKEKSLERVSEFSFEQPKLEYKSLSYAVWIASSKTLEVAQAAGGDL